MYAKFCILFVILIPVTQSNLMSQVKNEKVTVYKDKDEDKSSLVFVFDTTGSMHNDLKQLREGAEMILNTALEESAVIADFVFVPFHDPAVGPATVTKDKEIFKAALDKVHVYGGGDCPEKSLTGIQLALDVSRPRSYVYVFTDATANDHRFVGKVLDAVQRRQSQIVFVLTGHCNDLDKPQYKVYQQIAAASSGQVFNLNKTSVHKVLEFVRSSVRGRMVNLGSVVNKAGYDFRQEIPIDSSLGEVTVSVSGAKPSITVVDPSGQTLKGPPKLVTTLDLSEIMIVKVLQPEPGNWTIKTGSEEDYSVKVVGMSNLTFNHGFSVELPKSMAETSYRPLQGTYNHMMISLTETRPVQITYAEIQSLEGKTLFEIPLKEIDSERKVYFAAPFVPPDEFFYIAINGRDEYNQELRRIGATAVQAKPPDVPYLTVPKKIEARAHDTVILTCNIESLVPLTAMWTKDTVTIQSQITSLQSTSIDYVIDDMSEENVGTYRCVSKNVAGVSKASTDVILLVDPPHVKIAPDNKTLQIGEHITITCTVISDALLLKYLLVFNGTFGSDVTEINMEPNIEGLYVFNKTIRSVSERDDGIYSCVAANRGGPTTKSIHIKIQSEPSVQILGPHTLTKQIHSEIQLICSVEHVDRIVWVAPNNTVVREQTVNRSYTDMFDVKNVTEDGVWSCVGVRGERNATDSITITILIKPEVSIQGSKNISIVNGTSVDIVCDVIAKPTPRILWHRETERFLNNTITQTSPNKYQSIITLNSSREDVGGTYFCFGENSEGIHQDNVAVRVMRPLVLLDRFHDATYQLYSQIILPCHVESYPPPTIQWYHNNTILQTNDNVYLSENNNTLFITRLEFDNVGIYVCKAGNGFDSLEVKGTIGVFELESPVLSKEPVRRITQKGKSTILTCRVLKGNPDPTLTWQAKYNDSDTFTDLPRDVILNANNDEVIITRVEVHHWGVYRCVAENVVGKDVYDVLLVVQYPPETKSNLKQNNKPLEVEAGQKVRFSCEAVGVPPPIVLWSKDGRSVRYSKNVYLTDDSDLIIERATEFDSGLFSCNATSVLGSLQKNFTLVVYVPPTIQPVNMDPQIQVLEGDLVDLPCSGRGVPHPSVQWLHNGDLVEGGRKRLGDFGLRFVANLTDFGEYTCVVKNKYGNATFSFSVYIWVAPYIELPETSKNVLTGSNATLRCDAVGFPVPIIYWEYKSRVLTGNSSDISFNDFGNLNITTATSKHEGVYTCVAENLAGIDKKAIRLNINEPPKILEDNYTGPYIATEQDLELVITCKVTGKPKPFVIWMKDNRYLDLDSQYSIEVDGNLIIKSPTEDLSGQYTCIAKNNVGVANKTVAVEIYSLPSRMQSEESTVTQTFLEGSNATIECPIRSAAAHHVKWYKDATLITTGALTLQNITRHNTSTYACVVTNTIGSSYSKVIVNVEWGPRFRGRGGDLRGVRGEDLYLECAVDAKPRAKTKWLFNSKPLLGEDNERLKLMNIQLYHSGVYKCVASNTHGTVSRQFTLDVLVPPFISEFDLLDVQLKQGVNATLDCNAKGSPTPNIKWTFNNSNWHLQNTTLTTTFITPASEGLYRCDATNEAGAAYIVYRVSVAVPAAVTEVVAYTGGAGVTVEGGVKVAIGTHLRLSCLASGQPPPNIQWIKNGISISSNNGVITYADLVLNVDISHNGVYTCVAGNEGGVGERRVRVDVLEPPKIFQALNQEPSSNETKLEVLSGQMFYLHCHPYGNPMPAVYWFKEGVPLRLFDNTMISQDYGEVLVSNGATYEQNGNYTCVARNSVGNTSLVYLVDVLVPPPTSKEALKPITTHIGHHLNLTCPVEGSPPPNVVWIKQPYTEISDGVNRVMLVDDNYTLIITNTEIQDSGKYTCVMTNKVGTTEFNFDVTILKPPSIAGNVGGDITENHIVPLRRSVVLKCQADGNPVPKITWLKETQPLSENLSNIQQVLGNSLLAIWNADVRHGGQYICIAESSAGAQHRRYNVRVAVPGKWSSWTQWSYCNVTCGLGYQQRTRFCQYVDDYNNTYDKSTKSDKVLLDESACKGTSHDRRKCHMPPCEEDESQPRWSSWSKWSPCSSSCGAGTQTRSRRCRTTLPCTGDNVQIRRCPDLPKCNTSTELNQTDNEVYNSKEHSGETSAFIPEVTFETQPEVVNTQYATDVEEFYIKPDSKYSTAFYDVNVTDNLDKSYRGLCDPGFTHNNVTGNCDDIDECLIPNNLCHSTQVCVNTVGAYRCTCSRGFVSANAGQRCLDINECAQEIHGCSFACVNTAGGYVCACPTHLRLHVDRHTCVLPSEYQKPLPMEDDAENYLSTKLDFPNRYKKDVK